MRIFLFLLFCAALLLSCNNNKASEQDRPESAIRGVFKAIQSENFEKAAQFCTASSKKSLQDFATNLKMVSSSEKENLLAPFSMQITKIDCQESLGSTHCDLCCSEFGDVSLEMVQQDNKWFVQIEFLY